MTAGHQFGVGTDLAHPSMVKDVDPVSRADARKPMRDQQHGSVGGELPDPLIHRVFGPRIQRCGRLVADQQVGRAEEASRHGDALPLPAGELVAAEECLSKQCPVALWKLSCDLVGPRRGCGRSDLPVAASLASKCCGAASWASA
jgi:hypothetical protein